MISLMSVHTVAPGREEEYVAIQRMLWAKTWELEPETVRYEHYRATKTGQFISILTFKDLAAFLEHQIADYHDDVPWEGLFIEHELQWIDPIPGAHTLAQSEIPPLPADIDEKRKLYADMLPSARPQWWGPILAHREALA